MDPKIKNFIISTLRSRRGDDHIRAARAFHGMTEAQMNMEHGESGRTRKEILTSYLDYVDEIDEAIEAMRKL